MSLVSFEILRYPTRCVAFGPRIWTALSCFLVEPAWNSKLCFFLKKNHRGVVYGSQLPTKVNSVHPYANRVLFFLFCGSFSWELSPFSCVEGIKRLSLLASNKQFTAHHKSVCTPRCTHELKIRSTKSRGTLSVHQVDNFLSKVAFLLVRVSSRRPRTPPVKPDDGDPSWSPQ